jgi:hypothetical protein
MDIPPAPHFLYAAMFAWLYFDPPKKREIGMAVFWLIMAVWGALAAWAKA